MNAHDLAIARDPLALARRGPSSLALSSTFCHRRCVRDGMEARSRAGTRPHRWPRHSFRLLPREGPRLSEHLRCFSPLESNDGRDRSLGHPTGPPRYATVIPALQRGVSAPFVTDRPRPKLTALQARFAFGSTGRLGVAHRFQSQRPFDFGSKRFLRLVRPRN